MARPELEWPIPVYVTELRERVAVACRVPAGALAGRVPAPLNAETVRGTAVVALCFSNGRCVKPVGGVPSLASEFHLAEVLTPVVWRAACRQPVLGNLVLDLFTDSAGIARLVGKAVELDPHSCTQQQAAVGVRYECRMERSGGAPGAELLLDRAAEDAWPSGSLFGSSEEAEIRLTRPECYFAGSRDGRAVYAVPVHQYARVTRPSAWRELEVPILAELLGLDAADVVVDHVLFQKRCTHTWSFPPERVPTVPAAGAGLRSSFESGLRAASGDSVTRT
jgi:hypothetical protein